MLLLSDEIKAGDSVKFDEPYRRKGKGIVMGRDWENYTVAVQGGCLDGQLISVYHRHCKKYKAPFWQNVMAQVLIWTVDRWSKQGRLWHKIEKNNND